VSDPAAARYARVQAAMARHGLDALCLATPHLAAFASGARRVRVAGSGGMIPWVVILAGAPSAVVFTTDPDGAPAWMPREAVEPLRWDRDRQLARIAELIPDGSTVGGDLLWPWWEPLAGRRFVDATPVLAEATGPRTPQEIDAIGNALAAARTGLRSAAAAVMPGATAAEITARFAAAMSDPGAGFPLHEGLVRRNGAMLDGALDAGDTVGLEFGLWLDGHAGIAADTLRCGGEELTAMRRVWFGTLCSIAGRCRAGVSVGELRDAARAAGAGQEGLLAHGLGVGIEPPLVDLARDDDTRLRADTVLVLAPAVGSFRASRACVVTERGHRWLEPAP